MNGAESNGAGETQVAAAPGAVESDTYHEGPIPFIFLGLLGTRSRS